MRTSVNQSVKFFPPFSQTSLSALITSSLTARKAGKKPPTTPIAAVIEAPAIKTQRPNRNGTVNEAKVSRLPVSTVNARNGNVADLPRIPPRVRRKIDSPRKEIKISRFGNPKARSVRRFRPRRGADPRARQIQ